MALLLSSCHWLCVQSTPSWHFVNHAQAVCQSHELLAPSLCCPPLELILRASLTKPTKWPFPEAILVALKDPIASGHFFHVRFLFLQT